MGFIFKWNRMKLVTTDIATLFCLVCKLNKITLEIDIVIELRMS